MNELKEAFAQEPSGADNEHFLPLFEGYQPRECGEHRTVGPHRAWCFECHEWCYADAAYACRGCAEGLKNAKPKEYVYRIKSRALATARWKIAGLDRLKCILRAHPHNQIIERAEIGPWQEIGPEDV